MKLARPAKAHVFYLDPQTGQWTRTDERVTLPAGWIVQHIEGE